MTRITKIIRREAARTLDRGRPIIVTIEPGDILGFRPKGTRTTYRATVLSCYYHAAKIAALAAARQRAEDRKAARKEAFSVQRSAFRSR